MSLVSLRYDLFIAASSSIILALGVGTAILYRLQRNRDRALLWFSVFAILYGVRLLATNGLVVVAFQISAEVFRYFNSIITYCIAVPILLLLWEIFPSWRSILRYLLWVMAAFAVAGTLSDVIQQNPGSLFGLNNAIVLLALAAFLVTLFRQPGRIADVQILRAGLLAFSFAVAANNLAGLKGYRLAFNPEPVGLLLFLAALGRVLANRALSNEQRLIALDKELEIARSIQLSILPRQTPKGPQWDIAARYLPMTAVAGDFYDFLVIDEHRAGILIADVSGHDVPAALIASMVKIAIAAEAPHADDPAKVLSGMNPTLCGHLQGQYVTAAYLYLDLLAGKMRYAAAGHPALFWQHSNSEVEEVTENGLMLGLFPGAAYTTREGRLQTGDRFLLYTDGLLEAPNRAGDFFGSARARTILNETHSCRHRN